jgi:hypothetical protein
MRIKSFARSRLVVIAIVIIVFFVAVLARVAGLLVLDKPAEPKPAVKETICPVALYPDRHVDYFIKCADWRKS